MQWGLGSLAQNLANTTARGGLQSTFNKAVNQATGFIGSVAKLVEGENGEEGESHGEESGDERPTRASFERSKISPRNVSAPPSFAQNPADPSSLKPNPPPSASTSNSFRSNGVHQAAPSYQPQASTSYAPSLPTSTHASSTTPYSNGVDSNPAPPPSSSSSSAPPSVAPSLSDAFSSPPAKPQPAPATQAAAPQPSSTAAAANNNSKLAELRAKLAAEKGKMVPTAPSSSSQTAAAAEPPLQQQHSEPTTAAVTATPQAAVSAAQLQEVEAAAAAKLHAAEERFRARELQLTSEIDQLRSEKGEIGALLETFKRRMGEMEEKVKSAAQHEESVRRDAASCRADSDSLRRELESEIHKRDAEISALKQKLSESQRESESATATLEATRRELASQSLQHGQEVQVLRDEIARLASKMSQVENEAAVSISKAAAQSAAARREDAGEGEGAEVQELRAEVERLTQLVDQYDRERDELFQAHSDHEASLLKQLSDLRAAVNRSEDTNTRLASELASSLSSSEAESLKARLSECERERDKARADFQRLKTQVINREQDEEDKLAWRVEEELRHRLEKEKGKWEEEVAEEVAAAHRSQQDALAESQSYRIAMRNLESQLASKEQEVQNLNMALGSLAAESDVADTLRHELRVVRDHCTALTKETHGLKGAAEAAEGAKRAAEEELGRVRGEVDVWKAREHQSAQEVGTLRHALEEALKRLHSIGSESDTMVDRRIVSKLLVTYFEHKEDRLKKDVLALMARMLNLSDRDRQTMGIGGHEQGVTRKVFGVVGKVAALPLTLVEGGLALAAKGLGQEDDDDDLDPSSSGLLPRRSELFGASSSGSGALASNPLLALSKGEEGSISDLWLQFLTQQALMKAAAQRGSGGVKSPAGSSRGLNPHSGQALSPSASVGLPVSRPPL